MSNADLRKKICEKCILVKGFNTETNFNAIRQNFAESWRGTLATRTAGFKSSDQEWIIQFHSTEDFRCQGSSASDCKGGITLTQTMHSLHHIWNMDQDQGPIRQHRLYTHLNTRKFGGGDIEDVDYDEDTASAIITFEEDEAVDIVLQKMPIMFNNKVIEVEAHNVNVEESMEITEEYESNLSTSEPAPTCTIEVRGMTDRTTQDTIMYYFESRKGAKADVETIEYIEDKHMYLVTFEDEEAVDRTLQKNHTVDGSKLQVKKHIPPKRYPNKALVKGFSPRTTEDGIINFLEARTKFDVEGVDFGNEDSGKAIVTFCEPIDIGDIQTACKKRALDGSYLTVHPVVVTNCIVVRGFSEKTTESGLEYYFDNKRKSGVEGVTDVKMNKDEDYCVIYFENAEDALLACKRSHTIDNCKLKVQVFYDCLGVPADNEGPKFKPLPPLVITDIDKYKVNFLNHSTTKRDAIEKQLQEIYAQITWPSSKNDSKITIDCTLTKETKDCRKLAKSWGEEVRKSINTFVDALVTEKHSILQDAWAPVMEKLREINISDPDGVTVSVEKPPVCEIIIAGYTVPVKEVSVKIKQIIDEVSADLDRKKQSIQEDTKLKHHQLLILVYTHFKDKVKQKFEKMDVKIDTKKLVITFNGLSGNISSAKVMMFETINDITSASIGTKSPAYIQFLQKQEVKKYVGKKIKDKGLIGVWDIQGNTITMYSMSDADAVAASTILKDCVVETQVHVDNLQKSVMRSTKWAQYIQAIQDEYERKSIITEIIEDKQGQIILYCTSKGEAGMIREKIQDYFLDNSEKEITINLPPAQLKFLQEEMKDEVDDLEKGLRKQKIIVAVKGDGILIKGNPQGIKDAEHEIEALVKKIYRTKHSMDKPGLQELMNTGHGKSKLKQVSKQAGVVISSDSDEDERSTGQIRPRQGASSDERAVYSAAGGQEVIVVKGDITGLDVDVIVNAANKDLAHSGGLAKVLVQKGGKSIQDECDQFISYKGQLTEGECYCSKPGMLNCQMIVHAVGPVWQGGSNNEEDSLQQCVETALVETEKNKHTSIAIPALCTGIFGYPPHLATRAIAQAVRDYFKRSKSSIVQTVYLCDVNENSVDLFVKAGDKMFDKAKDRKQRFSGRQSGGMSSGHPGPISTGSIEIKIVKGELAKMRADVIVNTTSKGLQLNQGAVSNSLLKFGGQKLQDECSKKYPKGVDYGEVAVTTGGNLNCDIVCHGCLNKYSQGAIKVLEKFINGCLSKAEGKGCKSIAMPAMGTGKLGYPRALVAKHMYDTVQQYSSGNPNSCITKVLFVLYDKDDQTVKAFEAEEGNRQGSHHGRHDRDVTDKPTGYQGRGSSLDTWEDMQPMPQQGFDLDDEGFSLFRHHLVESEEDNATVPVFRRLAFSLLEDEMKPHTVQGIKTSAADFRREGIYRQTPTENDMILQRKTNVLNRVKSDQLSKMEHFLGSGQKRPEIRRMQSVPVISVPANTPIPKSKSQNSIKTWEKIYKPNYWLEDIEIELAMQLIKNNHPNIDGLQPVTVALAEGYKKPKGQFIQIINVSGKHWLTLSNIHCPPNSVRVFDSWKRHLQGDTKRAIFAVVDRDSNGQVSVDMCPFQRQRNNVDCGLFAVASMVAIAYGTDPSKLIWDTRLLRSHFVQCLNQSQMTPFPLYQDSPPNMLQEKTFVLTLTVQRKDLTKKHQKQTPPGNQYSSAADKEYSVNMGNVVLKVYQGDITNVKVDAIVNGTNTDLDLTIGKEFYFT
ncbi:unnamed protein product [Mytilus edulis]|uniref:Poly [ADP-ribose] polymerase n=1 Tax=Mytilus edulis TaxID=6550 RepID=A0A8S3RM35_MYTED|nr:unnamed protein product [Mytilus edulis]